MHRPRGFSLVELLVAISVTAILIALALPALAGAIGSARRTGSMANLRTLVQAIGLYADGSGELYPAVEEGRVYYRRPSAISGSAYPYWQVNETWALIVNEVTLPLETNAAVYRSPGIDPGEPPRLFPTSYQYSTSFVAAPEWWTPEARLTASMLRARRVSEVVFPSSKALLWDVDMGWRRVAPVRTERGFAEKTVVAVADSSVRDGVQTDGPVFENPALPAVRLQGWHNTPEGVRGRDF